MAWKSGCEVALATKEDIDAIVDLQERNLPDHGGTLSARLSRAWFEAAITAMPVIVARRAGRVVGYLVSSPIAGYEDVPVVQAMLRAPTVEHRKPMSMARFV